MYCSKGAVCGLALKEGAVKFESVLIQGLSLAKKTVGCSFTVGTQDHIVSSPPPPWGSWGLIY